MEVGQGPYWGCSATEKNSIIIIVILVYNPAELNAHRPRNNGVAVNDVTQQLYRNLSII
jgi:hypothetical protein